MKWERECDKIQPKRITAKEKKEDSRIIMSTKDQHFTNVMWKMLEDYRCAFKKRERERERERESG